jgi:hypothetical protein
VSESLLFLGPILGLLAGAGIGASLGTLVSALIWWRILRRRDNPLEGTL